MQNELTKTEQKVFSAIVEFINKNSYSPSVRELCALTGGLSSGTVHKYIGRLVEKGFVEYEKGKMRSLRIVGKMDNKTLLIDLLNRKQQYGCTIKEDFNDSRYSRTTYIENADIAEYLLKSSDKDKFIDLVNSILKDAFDYVPLHVAIRVTERLIESGAILLPTNEREDKA